MISQSLDISTTYTAFVQSEAASRICALIDGLNPRFFELLGLCYSTNGLDGVANQPSFGFRTTITDGLRPHLSELMNSQKFRDLLAKSPVLTQDLLVSVLGGPLDISAHKQEESI